MANFLNQMFQSVNSRAFHTIQSGLDPSGKGHSMRVGELLIRHNSSAFDENKSSSCSMIKVLWTYHTISVCSIQSVKFWLCNYFLEFLFGLLCPIYECGGFSTNTERESDIHHKKRSEERKRNRTSNCTHNF